MRRFGGAVSRILSARDRSRGENHLSVAAHPKLCVREDRGTGRSWSFLFGLAPDGACHASAIALGAVGSYPTFSPLPSCRSSAAVYSLWRYPSTRLERASRMCLRLNRSYAASCPMVFGLSSPGRNRKRSSAPPKRQQSNTEGTGEPRRRFS